MAEEKSSPTDVESDKALIQKEIPYPKSVFLIIATELCERFSYYGMRTVLSLYLRNSLGFLEETATVLYHLFVSLCYFAPILGATLADSFLGKFRTIFYLCVIYIIGELVLTLGSFGEAIPNMPASAVSFIGLFLIAVGTGGIKPCVAPFGAEQFQLPEQETKMKQYFSWFYASINLGATASTLLTPNLRNRECLDASSCFPLAFGVPAALMVVALTSFVIGKILGLYKINIPEENIIVKTVKCIWYALSQWSRRRKAENLNSVMDYAKDKYDDQFVEDIKALQGVIYIFLPVPVFWSLFDQQGSSWTFQATRMKSKVGGFEILPDMMQVANAILILIFIPIFDFIIYPIFAKVKLFRTPLQRIVAGGMLAGVSFLIAGFVELKLQQSYPELPAENFMEVSFYNSIPAHCSPVDFTLLDKDNVATMIKFNETDIVKLTLKNETYTIMTNQTVVCNKTQVSFAQAYITPLKLVDAHTEEGVADPAKTVLISIDRLNNTVGIISVGEFPNKIEKPGDGFPFIKFIWNFKPMTEVNIVTSRTASDGEVTVFQNITINPSVTSFINSRKLEEIYGGNHTVGDLAPFSLGQTSLVNTTIYFDGKEVAIDRDRDFEFGGNYLFLLESNDADSCDITVFVTTGPNDFPILWQIPQYMVITAGEIMFSITTLSFAFTEAPESMKAVVMAVQNLTVAFGNVLDIILVPALTKLIGTQAYIFFFFAGLMFLDMILMAIMTRKYQYKDKTHAALSKGK